MNKVKRGIIMAAGMGNRLQPITLETPKPLIKVNGIRMIDTVIQGLHYNGIDEIYVVVGHLKEQFYVLEEEYDGLKIVENPYYKTCNNISSLYMVRDYIEEAIILDGDQIIYNNDVLISQFEKSGYNAVWTELETDEWLMQVKENRVISCSRKGGKKGWKLYSISRWTKEDGQKLKKNLEYEFTERRNTQIYWDDIAMFCHPEEYDLGIIPMNEGDVVEIDNLDELVVIDSSYEKYRSTSDKR